MLNEALDIVNSFKSKYGLAATTDTLHYLINGFSASNRIDDALQFLQEARKNGSPVQSRMFDTLIRKVYLS